MHRVRVVYVSVHHYKYIDVRAASNDMVKHCNNVCCQKLIGEHLVFNLLFCYSRQLGSSMVSNIIIMLPSLMEMEKHFLKNPPEACYNSSFSLTVRYAGIQMYCQAYWGGEKSSMHLTQMFSLSL